MSNKINRIGIGTLHGLLGNRYNTDNLYYIF